MHITQGVNAALSNKALTEEYFSNFTTPEQARLMAHRAAAKSAEDSKENYGRHIS